MYTDAQGHTYLYRPVVEICKGRHDGEMGMIVKSYEDGSMDVLTLEFTIIRLQCGDVILRGSAGPLAP
jgi:hypothetical protein